MSVLEQFLQISMVFLLVTLGINMMLTSFGEPMTGEFPGVKFPDYNAGSFESPTSYPNTVQQTSTAATELSISNATTLLSNITTNIYNFTFALQITIIKIMEDFGLDSFATALVGLITAIQVFGAVYMGVSLFAIIRGSGGTP